MLNLLLEIGWLTGSVLAIGIFFLLVILLKSFITVGADTTACVCIDDDNEPMLYSAVERLMGKSRSEIKEQVQQTLIGNFRGALNKATPLQAIGMEELP